VVDEKCSIVIDCVRCDPYEPMRMVLQLALLFCVMFAASASVSGRLLMILTMSIVIAEVEYVQ